MVSSSSMEKAVFKPNNSSSLCMIAAVFSAADELRGWFLRSLMNSLPWGPGYTLKGEQEERAGTGSGWLQCLVLAI